MKYVVKRDRAAIYRFASLQSEKGRALLSSFKVDPSLDSVVLIEKKTIYIKSTAALRILKALGGFSSIFYVFIFVPIVVRDFFYDLIASMRYKIFGKETCELPTKSDYSERFL